MLYTNRAVTKLQLQQLAIVHFIAKLRTQIIYSFIVHRRYMTAPDYISLQSIIILGNILYA